jgi:hypothetical protein
LSEGPTLRRDLEAPRHLFRKAQQFWQDDPNCHIANAVCAYAFLKQTDKFEDVGIIYAGRENIHGEVGQCSGQPRPDSAPFDVSLCIAEPGVWDFAKGQQPGGLGSKSGVPSMRRLEHPDHIGEIVTKAFARAGKCGSFSGVKEMWIDIQARVNVYKPVERTLGNEVFVRNSKHFADRSRHAKPSLPVGNARAPGDQSLLGR